MLAIWGVVSRFSLTVQEETLQVRKKEKSIQEQSEVQGHYEKKKQSSISLLAFFTLQAQFYP